MSEIKVNSIKGVGASAAAISINNTDGTCTANITNNLSNRNLIINGAMQVAQRGTSSTVSGYGTVDRFNNNFGGADEALTQAQVDLSSSDTPYSSGFRKAFKITNGNQTSGAGAADYVNIFTKLEAQDIASSGWNYVSNSSSITLSFWVKSSVAQTMYVRLNANDASKAFSFAISVTTSWQKITKTISGDSSLVFNNDNGSGLEIYFIPFYGTNYTTSGHTNDAWITDSGSDQVTDMTSTWWTTNDATFEFTGVQLEVGSVATDFEHRSFAQELALCQRYCQAIIHQAQHQAIALGHAEANNETEVIIPLKVQMRATPTFTFGGTLSGAMKVYERGAAIPDVSAISLVDSANEAAKMQITVSATDLQNGNANLLYFYDNPSTPAERLIFSAEL